MRSYFEDSRTRRQFLKGLGALGLVGAAGAGAWRALAGAGQSGPSGGAAGPPSLERLARNVVSGGPGKDGIPAIDRPRFVSADDARFLRDEDVVFGLVEGREARAYPQLVLVWHEIANDVIGGRRASVTYCPLTGSVVAFRGRAPDGRPLTFGTTGSLVNSNLLMYDRETDSEWPQLLGRAIKGKLRGATLTEIPLEWTTWGQWRRSYPRTRVLSTSTGYARSYGSDPYGSYTPLGGYYESGGPIFPVIARSRRLEDKEVVVGVKGGPSRLAVGKSRLREARLLPAEAGRMPLLAVWDAELEGARVFERRAGRRPLRFAEGDLRDRSTGTTWDATGRALAGPLAGAQLAPADFIEVMWFAWYAFYPRTAVIA